MHLYLIYTYYHISLEGRMPPSEGDMSSEERMPPQTEMYGEEYQ